MIVAVLFIGIIIGIFLNFIIKKISDKIIMQNDEINYHKLTFPKVLSILVFIFTSLLIIISFCKIGFNMLFLKAVVFDCILIVTSFIDYKHNIIPNKVVLLTIILGIIFIFIKNISIVDAVLGMLAGGGILLLLGLVPKAIGGGDIKFMFALGLFLGIHKVIYSLLFAFISAAIISAILLMLGIKGRKDHIPFGPFLAIGSFVSFHLF